MNVPREQVIARLREAGWRFKRQADRVEIYKKPNEAQRVDVPRRDLLPRAIVAHILRQGGLSPAEIEQFLIHCTSN
jgi:predicted RNA binding protein YcfA (HicA-like mRNA interferase family)